MAASPLPGLVVGSQVIGAACGVVLPPPGFDQDLSLGQGVEDGRLEKLWSLRWRFDSLHR